MNRTNPQAKHSQKQATAQLLRQLDSIKNTAMGLLLSNPRSVGLRTLVWEGSSPEFKLKIIHQKFQDTENLAITTSASGITRDVFYAVLTKGKLVGLISYLSGPLADAPEWIPYLKKAAVEEKPTQRAINFGKKMMRRTYA